MVAVTAAYPPSVVCHAGETTSDPEIKPSASLERSSPDSAPASNAPENTDSCASGSVISARPSASLRIACSDKPRPAPPRSSGSIRPSQPASAMADQMSRSRSRPAPRRALSALAPSKRWAKAATLSRSMANVPSGSSRMISGMLPPWECDCFKRLSGQAGRT
jgi:hypothetical protein